MFSEQWNKFMKHVFTKNLRLTYSILLEGQNPKEEFEKFIDSLSCNKIIGVDGDQDVDDDIIK